MAIARLSVKVGKAGKAAPHAEYIDRDEEKKRKKRNRLKLTSNIVPMETCRNGRNIIRLPFGRQPTFMNEKMAVPIESMKSHYLEK